MNPTTGVVRNLLRVEGLAVLVLGVTAYAACGQHGWGLFALLFLVPDLSMLGYLGGPRLGAIAYNAAHTYTVPAVVGSVGIFSAGATATDIALIWVAHIGMDRAIGFGLKYSTSFNDTHLGPVGRRSP